MDLGKLYEKYNILIDAKNNVSEHIQDYADAIEGARGGEKEKKLSTQILSKFFKHFPSLQIQALNAILDLCEDDDSMIRICAMKALPIMCKDSQEHLNKIVYILAQLLQLEDQEYNIASSSLKLIYKDFPQQVIKALFLFIQNSTDVNVREKCITFILKTLLTTPVNGSKEEIEDTIIEESKKLLTYANPEEFVIIMPYLISSKYGKTLSGANQLLDTIAEQMDLDQEFDPQETGSIEKLVMCTKYAITLFSPKCESNKFFIYLCDHVLPQWSSLDSLENSKDVKLQILRLLAEVSLHCGKLDNPSSHVVNIFSLLKSHMPPPPDTDETTLPSVDFTAVECLLFSFHRIARQCPDFLTHDAEVLRDFRARLLYFSRCAQGCKKVLNHTIATRVSLQSKDVEKMKMAPSILENIRALVKDLFYSPPIYKVSITLSFLKKAITPEPSVVKTGVTKRHIPITFDGEAGKGNKQIKTSRGENRIYQPPSGKFSSNSSFQSYDRSGRGRGHFRGRGRGNLNRNWRN
ncbi:apoptosis inhibitor 5 [Coccinella septempunctata]|uniref:apoptosis inhibitor 5 n=1 Tax=Coccinella septempunctata TaxID=41139 RepID=UPI001D08B93B|nr:apoptosis inhibitor 5 [Coccinella septempunctata]